MKLTVPGVDVVRIDEDNMDAYISEANSGKRFHVIKIDFDKPTAEKVKSLLAGFSNTNRFIISDHVKFYNGCLKHVGKKYYIQNTSGENFISFIRKNNKVLIDFTRMTQSEKTFLLENYLGDLLRNAEIILIDEPDMSEYASMLRNWPGNVIVRDVNYII